MAWRCGASRAAGDAARKPWPAAVPVAWANRRRASGSLDDAPHRLRPPFCPADRPRDLYGSLSALLGISRSRGQPAITDAAIGGIGMPDFGMGTFGGRASSPGPAGCSCPAASRSSTRSRRLPPLAFVAPVDGAIGGTERVGFEFTAAEPITTASADCVPGADGETASSADAPDAATTAMRQAPRVRRCATAVIRASTRDGRRARARDSCWPTPRHRGSRSVRRATSATHRPSHDCRCRLPIPR